MDDGSAVLVATGIGRDARKQTPQSEVVRWLKTWILTWGGCRQALLLRNSVGVRSKRRLKARVRALWD